MAICRPAEVASGCVVEMMIFGISPRALLAEEGVS